MKPNDLEARESVSEIKIEVPKALIELFKQQMEQLEPKPPRLTSIEAVKAIYTDRAAWRQRFFDSRESIKNDSIAWITMKRAASLKFSDLPIWEERSGYKKWVQDVHTGNLNAVDSLVL